VDRFRIWGQQPVKKLCNPLDCTRVSIDSDQEIMRLQRLNEMPCMTATAKGAVDNGSALRAWSVQARPLDDFLE
jgi:hypothetical protein